MVVSYDAAEVLGQDKEVKLRSEEINNMMCACGYLIRLRSLAWALLFILFRLSSGFEPRENRVSSFHET